MKKDKNNVIKFIEQIALREAQRDLFELFGNHYPFDDEAWLKKQFDYRKEDYFVLWKSMFGEDLEKGEK